MSTIVVGVDPSEGGKAALRFAFDEAKLRGARLRVVHAWQFGPFGYIDTLGREGSYPAVGADLSDLHDAAEAALDDTLREVIAEAARVDVERRVVEGGPGAVLVEESRGADLVVVGSRGLGGFTGLLLGSVGQQCAHHAACPVVIVHRKAED
jgi:nucleotide-binding universal stress UspA family protein